LSSPALALVLAVGGGAVVLAGAAAGPGNTFERPAVGGARPPPNLNPDAPAAAAAAGAGAATVPATVGTCSITQGVMKLLLVGHCCNSVRSKDWRCRMRGSQVM
jgi:hypothetical protein